MGFLGKIFGSKEVKRKEEKKPEEPMKSEPVENKPQPEVLKTSYEEEPEPFIALNAEEAASGILAGRFQILDVRTPYEYQSHHIADSILIPLQQLENRYNELDSSRETLVVCEHGIRSHDACWFLSENGFKRLYHLTGGLSVYKGPQEGTKVGSKNPE